MLVFIFVSFVLFFFSILFFSLENYFLWKNRAGLTHGQSKLTLIQSTTFLFNSSKALKIPRWQEMYTPRAYPPKHPTSVLCYSGNTLLGQLWSYSECLCDFPQKWVFKRNETTICVVNNDQKAVVHRKTYTALNLRVWGALTQTTKASPLYMRCEGDKKGWKGFLINHIPTHNKKQS